MCFSTVFTERTVPVAVPGNGSGGSSSAFGSCENGSDGSGFRFRFLGHPDLRFFSVPNP